MDWANVADAVSSRILYEPREGCARRKWSDSDGIAPDPVFAEGSIVFAFRESRPRAARRCRLQLLLDFLIDLSNGHAAATKLTEMAPTHSSIGPLVDRQVSPLLNLQSAQGSRDDTDHNDVGVEM